MVGGWRLDRRKRHVVQSRWVEEWPRVGGGVATRGGVQPEDWCMCRVGGWRCSPTLSGIHGSAAGANGDEAWSCEMRAARGSWRGRWQWFTVCGQGCTTRPRGSDGRAASPVGGRRAVEVCGQAASGGDVQGCCRATDRSRAPWQRAASRVEAAVRVKSRLCRGSESSRVESTGAGVGPSATREAGAGALEGSAFASARSGAPWTRPERGQLTGQWTRPEGQQTVRAGHARLEQRGPAVICTRSQTHAARRERQKSRSYARRASARRAGPSVAERACTRCCCCWCI